MLCRKHEMYSPGHSEKHLLYESRFQCKKLCQVCTCRGHAQGCVRGICTLEPRLCPSLCYARMRSGQSRAGLPGQGWVSAVPALSRRGAHALASAALQSPARRTVPGPPSCARPGRLRITCSGLLTSGSHSVLAAKELLLLCEKLLQPPQG